MENRKTEKKIRVLLADDHQLFREGLKRMSFNFMAAITICSDFGAKKKNKMESILLG